MVLEDPCGKLDVVECFGLDFQDPNTSRCIEAVLDITEVQKDKTLYM